MYQNSVQSYKMKNSTKYNVKLPTKKNNKKSNIVPQKTKKVNNGKIITFHKQNITTYSRSKINH